MEHNHSIFQNTQVPSLPVVSPGNYATSIARFFEERKKIEEDLTIIVNSSLLNDQDKSFFLEK